MTRSARFTLNHSPVDLAHVFLVLDDQDGLKVCPMSNMPRACRLLRFWCNTPCTVPVLLSRDTALVLI